MSPGTATAIAVGFVKKKKPSCMNKAWVKKKLFSPSQVKLLLMLLLCHSQQVFILSWEDKVLWSPCQVQVPTGASMELSVGETKYTPPSQIPSIIDSGPQQSKVILLLV